MQKKKNVVALHSVQDGVDPPPLGASLAPSLSPGDEAELQRLAPSLVARHVPQQKERVQCTAIEFRMSSF